MYREEITHYSHSLEREMHVMVYGKRGMPKLMEHGKERGHERI